MRSDDLYANMQQDTNSAPIIDGLSGNVATMNDYEEDPDTFNFSDLQGIDNNVHEVAPSGDLYAQVPKRQSLEY